MENSLECYLDGDALCIIEKGFVNLQESKAMFIALSKKKLKGFRELLAIDLNSI